MAFIVMTFKRPLKQLKIYSELETEANVRVFPVEHLKFQAYFGMYGVVRQFQVPYCMVIKEQYGSRHICSLVFSLAFSSPRSETDAGM